jgi:hypothetical protein
MRGTVKIDTLKNKIKKEIGLGKQVRSKNNKE